jgi:hypothetical protein
VPTHLEAHGSTGNGSTSLTFAHRGGAEASMMTLKEAMIVFGLGVLLGPLILWVAM